MKPTTANVSPIAIIGFTVPTVSLSTIQVPHAAANKAAPKIAKRTSNNRRWPVGIISCAPSVAARVLEAGRYGCGHARGDCACPTTTYEFARDCGKRRATEEG